MHIELKSVLFYLGSMIVFSSCCKLKYNPCQLNIVLNGFSNFERDFVISVLEDNFELREFENGNQKFKIYFRLPGKKPTISFYANDSTLVSEILDVSIVDVSNGEASCSKGLQQLFLNFKYNDYSYTKVKSEGLVINKY